MLKWKRESSEIAEEFRISISILDASCRRSRWSHLDGLTWCCHAGIRTLSQSSHSSCWWNVNWTTTTKKKAIPKISGMLCSSATVSVRETALISRVLWCRVLVQKFYAQSQHILNCKSDRERNNNKTSVLLLWKEVFQRCRGGLPSPYGHEWERSVMMTTTTVVCALRKCFHSFLFFSSFHECMLCVLCAADRGNVEQLIQCFILLFLIRYVYAESLSSFDQEQSNSSLSLFDQHWNTTPDISDIKRKDIVYRFRFWFTPSCLLPELSMIKLFVVDSNKERSCCCCCMHWSESI